MKKGYYILQCTFNNKEELEEDGVYKKVLSQCKSFSKCFDIKLDVVNYTKNLQIKLSKSKFYQKLFYQKSKCYKRNICLSKFTYRHAYNACAILKRLPLYPRICRWEYRNQYKNADFIYFRRVLHDKYLITFLRKIKKENSNIKIIYEVPTYPYDKEYGKLKDFLVLLKDKHYRKKLHKYVDIIVTYSNDRTIFGIPTIQTINGLDFDSAGVSNQKQNPNSINIIAVARIAYWHGYDRFIKGLGEYYKNGGKRSIILHIVGDGKLIREYKQLVKQCQINNNVIFHGFKSGKELKKIYDECVLGLNSLGLHRIGLDLSSTLKTREYGAKGLPIITSSKIDYIPKEYKYQLNVPANESNINIEKVINFYDNIYGTDASIRDISNSIRDFAKSKCDTNMTMKPIIDYIKSNIPNSYEPCSKGDC